MAFDELVDLALRIADTTGASGIAKLRDVTRTNLTDDRLLHSSLQLEIASLARHVGAEAELEVKRQTAPPVDVNVRRSGLDVGVEAFVLLTDEQMRAGRAYSEVIGNGMSEIGWRHDVVFDGELTEQLDEHETAAWFAALGNSSEEAARAQATVRLNHRAGVVDVTPARFAVKATFTGPPQAGQGWNRIARRLQQKAGQAEHSGATWLRFDLRDGLWQFTPWSQQRLPDKTDALAASLFHTLRDTSIRGVVASSGSCMAQGVFVGESYRGPSALGMRRMIGQFRVRETIIVPLRDDALAEADLWYEQYDGEPTWRSEMLSRAGLLDVQLE